MMRPSHSTFQSGSFIIEALISLLIFAVSIIGMVALIGQGLNQVGQSKARNDASFLAGELLAGMWINSTVNIDDWNTRLTTAVPGANASVYFATCDCAVSALPPYTYGCSGTAKTGSQPIGAAQPVTICITWNDKKDANERTRMRLYQTSTVIERN